MKLRRTGRRMNPFETPNMMIPNHILKNTTNPQLLAKLSVMIAKKVEKEPWITLDPILDNDFWTLQILSQEGYRLIYVDLYLAI